MIMTLMKFIRDFTMENINVTTLTVPGMDGRVDRGILAQRQNFP